MRKAEAYWMEKYSRWQIVAYRCGVRRSFYSSKPGKLGKHEAEAKADKWLKTFDTTKNYYSNNYNKNGKCTAQKTLLINFINFNFRKPHAYSLQFVFTCFKNPS